MPNGTIATAMSSDALVMDTPNCVASSGSMGCGMYSVPKVNTVMNRTALSVDGDTGMDYVE